MSYLLNLGGEDEVNLIAVELIKSIHPSIVEVVPAYSPRRLFCVMLSFVKVTQVPFYLKEISKLVALNLRFVVRLGSLVVFKKFNCILNLDFLGVTVGDCYLSSWLGSTASKGRVDPGLSSIPFFIKRCLSLSLYNLALDIVFVDADSCGQVFFYCPEIAYNYEARRRLALRKNFQEIRYCPYENSFIKLNSWLGREIALLKPLDHTLANFITKNHCSDGIKLLSDLVMRRQKYCAAIDSDIKVDYSPSKDEIKILEFKGKSAVVFLHCVSDAQYIYGPDCFLDLNDWLVTTIKLCQKHAIRVILKLHPGMYSSENNLEVDRVYFNLLVDNLGVSRQWLLNPSGIESTNQPSIFLAAYNLPSHILFAYSGNVVGISHHGSVGFELLHQGFPCILSNSSLYFRIKNHPLILTYSTRSQYEYLLLDSFSPSRRCNYVSRLHHASQYEKPLEAHDEFAYSYFLWIQRYSSYISIRKYLIDFCHDNDLEYQGPQPYTNGSRAMSSNPPYNCSKFINFILSKMALSQSSLS